MKKVTQIVLLLVCQVLWLETVSASDAWWVLCDSCESNTEFRNAVLAAPGGDGIYFVSNSNTLETRKYEEYSTYEDFSDGVVKMTWVSDLEISAAKKNAFASVLQGASYLHVVVDGGELTGATSVADHISSGVLAPSLLHVLGNHLIIQGYFPTAQQAGEMVGTGLSWIWRRELSRTESTARQWPLTITVPYPDGSKLRIRLSPDAQTWTELEARDADGNILPVYGPDSSGHAPVDSAGFLDRSFSFGQGSDWEHLYDWLTGNQQMECTYTLYPDRVVVTCPRPN